MDAKFHTYLKLIESIRDHNGFIEFEQCDSLLFTGLYGCIPGTKVNIQAAFNPKDGTWHRRPLEYPCCFNPSKHVALKQLLLEVLKAPGDYRHIIDGNGSSISRDMLLGLAWFSFFNKRLDISEQVIKYALSHWLVMGKGSYSRIVISPGLLGTFACISAYLGGPTRTFLMNIPADSGSLKLTGFQAHLQVLHILLRREITGKLSGRSSKVIAYHAARMPQNPLFLHAAGKDEEALKTLSNEAFWPSDRLPTNHDRKAEWLMQRDVGDDWMPELTKERHQHSGADYAWLYWLITKA